MVPRLEMATTFRKLDTKVTPVTVVPAFGGFAEAGDSESIEEARR